MKPFAYAAPASLDEALSLLSDRWGQAEILAGGTDLVTCLKQNLTAPARVVSLKNIGSLKGVRREGDKLQIGAMTTLADLAKESAVQEQFAALAAAVRGIGSEQMISAGTVGGDLCQRPRCWYFRTGHGLFGQEAGGSLVERGDNRYHAIFGNGGPALFVHPSSLAPALIALGATVNVAGPSGRKREVAAADFFQTPKTDQDRETVLKPNEIVTGVAVPVKGLKNATYEVRHRHGLDWPYVTASVALRLEGKTAREPQVVLGHVAPVPWKAPGAARVLDGKVIDDALAGQCAEAATAGAKALSGNAYKIQLVKTAVKRAVLLATGQRKAEV